MLLLMQLFQVFLFVQKTIEKSDLLASTYFAVALIFFATCNIQILSKYVLSSEIFLFSEC